MLRQYISSFCNKVTIHFSLFYERSRKRSLPKGCSKRPQYIRRLAMDGSTRKVKGFVSRQIYVASIVNLNNVNLHEKALYLIILGTLVYTLPKTQRPRCIPRLFPWRSQKNKNKNKNSNCLQHNASQPKSKLMHSFFFFFLNQGCCPAWNNACSKPSKKAFKLCKRKSEKKRKKKTKKRKIMKMQVLEAPPRSSHRKNDPSVQFMISVLINSKKLVLINSCLK